MEFKCPARESSEFLCDRVGEYQINGTVWCNTHARRIIEGDDLTVKVRETVADATFANWQVTTNG